jgi:hypothetical protein
MKLPATLRLYLKLAIERRQILARRIAGRAVLAMAAAVILLAGLALLEVGLFLGIRPTLGDLGAVLLIAGAHFLGGVVLAALALREPASAELTALAEAETAARDLVGEEVRDIPAAAVRTAQHGIGQIGEKLMPVNLVPQLFDFYSHNVNRLVASQFDAGIGMLSREQGNSRKQLAASGPAAAQSDPTAAVWHSGANFGVAVLEAMQQQTRQNIAFVENAVTLWWPFVGTLKK